MMFIDLLDDDVAQLRDQNTWNTIARGSNSHDGRGGRGRGGGSLRGHRGRYGGHMPRGGWRYGGRRHW